MKNNGRFTTLRASTLAETLIMMIVAGIVFYGVMEGMTLFSRHSSGLSVKYKYNMALCGDYFRLEGLVTSSDSIAVRERMTLYYGGKPHAQLYESDSTLIVVVEARTDSLFRGMAALSFSESRYSEGLADTVYVGLNTGGIGLKISFAPLRQPDALFRSDSEQEEEKYTYR